MLLDKHDKIVKTLDFRGTSFKELDNLNGEQIFKIVHTALQMVNSRCTDEFKVTDLAPKNGWDGTVFEPMANACDDKNHADRLFGVIIKQALIMTPILFKQTASPTEQDHEGARYKRVAMAY